MKNQLLYGSYYVSNNFVFRIFNDYHTKGEVLGIPAYYINKNKLIKIDIQTRRLLINNKYAIKTPLGPMSGVQRGKIDRFLPAAYINEVCNNRNIINNTAINGLNTIINWLDGIIPLKDTLITGSILLSHYMTNMDIKPNDIDLVITGNYPDFSKLEETMPLNIKKYRSMADLNLIYTRRITDNPKFSRLNALNEVSKPVYLLNINNKLVHINITHISKKRNTVLTDAMFGKISDLEMFGNKEICLSISSKKISLPFISECSFPQNLKKGWFFTDMFSYVPMLINGIYNYKGRLLKINDKYVLMELGFDAINAKTFVEIL